MPNTTDLVWLGAGVIAADRAGYISLGSEANNDKSKSERPPIFNIMPGNAGGGNAGGGGGGVNEEFLSGMLDEIRDMRQDVTDSETPTTIFNFPQLTNPYIPGGNPPQIPQIPGVPDIPGIPKIPTLPEPWEGPTIPRMPGPGPGPEPAPIVPPGKPDVRNPLVFLYRGAEGTAETGERWGGGIMDTLITTGTTLGESTKALSGREYTTRDTFAQGRGNDPAGGSQRRIYQGKLRDIVGGGKGNAWVPGFRPEQGDFIPGSGPLLGKKNKKKIVDTLGTAGPINTGGLIQ